MVDNKQFENLLELQDKLNIATCGENWKSGICEKSGKIIDWKSAVIAECGEALESLGYKHWKKQDIDMNNAQMELIDILHFLLSQALSLHGKDEAMNFKINKNDVSFKDDLSCIEAIIEILEFSLVNTPVAAIKYIFDNSDKFDLTTQQIYDLYMAKHWLNGFRQENGYQDGTYIKVQTYPEIDEPIEDNMLVVLLVKDYGLDEAKELFVNNYKRL
jgi:dimeric dUTPase (all-alpha-NTP-PPase superfamily)